MLYGDRMAVLHSPRRSALTVLRGGVRLLIALSAASAAAVEPSPEASTRRWAFEWKAPPQCAFESAIPEELERLLGAEPESLGAIERVAATVRVVGPQHQLSLVFEESHRRSVRVIEAQSCDHLVEAGALAIALALEPSFGEDDELWWSDSEVAPSPAVDDPTSDGGLEREGTPPAPARPTRWQAFFETVVDAGSLPSPELALSVGVRVRRPRWSVAAHALLARSQRQTVGPGQFVEFGLWLFGGRSCGALVQSHGGAGGLSVAGCVVLEAGSQGAEGLGLERSRSVRRLRLAPGAALESAFGLTPLASVSARLESVLPLNRARAAVDDAPLLGQPSRVALRGYLGLDLRFD